MRPSGRARCRRSAAAASAQRAQRPERAVDVEPQTLAAAQIRKRRQIVDRTGIHRAGGADDQERAAARAPDLSAIASSSRSIRMAPRSSTGNHVADGAIRCRHIFSGLDDAAMGLRRRIGGELRAGVAQAVCRTASPELRRARHQQGNEIRGRRSGDEHAGRVGREIRTSRAAQAAIWRSTSMADVIAPAAVGVEAGRQHLGHHPDRRAGAMNPAHEQRMPVAVAIRLNEGSKIVEHRIERLRRPRQRLVEMAAAPRAEPPARPGGREWSRGDRSCRRVRDGWRVETRPNPPGRGSGRALPDPKTRFFDRSRASAESFSAWRPGNIFYVDTDYGSAQSFGGLATPRSPRITDPALLAFKYETDSSDAE